MYQNNLFNTYTFIEVLKYYIGYKFGRNRIPYKCIDLENLINV